MSAFEQAKSGNGGAPAIGINISGLQGPTVDMVESLDAEDVTDVEIKDYDSEENNG